jgi:SagB-type dehydrogenase family enzyme
MRLRSSKTAIIFPHNGQSIIFDYLTKSAIAASTEVIHWFNAFSDWSSVQDIVNSHPEYEPSSIATTVESMTQAGLLIEEGDVAATQQIMYEETWQWGPLAATFHFSTQNLEFVSLEQSQELSLSKAESSPSPPLNWHDRYAERPALQLDPPSDDLSFFEIVRRRRSSRTPLPVPLKRQQLANCLYSALAITDHVVTPTGLLPLTPTPSGGARNPYEAFVLVQNVEGLDRGFYHYSGLKHQLRLVSDAVPNNPADLLAGQDWANNMPVLIFLVAVLERTMWKYNEDSAYKVVLIESGHIGQNILLAATAQGLGACPTAALSHSLIADHLGLDQITHTPVYALALCHPGSYDAEIVPNPHIGTLSATF